jgi:hypothetical protein
MPSPTYKISSKSTNQFKSCAHLRSLNVCHFGMAEGTTLNKCDVEVTLNGSTCLPNFTKSHRLIQKLLVGDTHRQAGDLISPLSFCESRLKKYIILNVLLK